MAKRSPWLALIPIVVAIVKAIFRLFTAKSTTSAGGGAAKPSRSGAVDGGIAELFRLRRSDDIVTASGLIVKILPDDTDTSDGSEQHQKFLVEVADTDRLTIKICHNLKFGRVPAREDQTVRFCGEYQWTDKGGSVHWTHHDPRGTHADGWIEVGGKRYG